MKKIAIIGANGQLGNDLSIVLSKKDGISIVRLTHSDIEIKDKTSIENCLNSIDTNIVINTAAYVRVDDAETNQTEAFLTNAVANQYLARYCETKKIKYVYISTDYVFGNDTKRTKPYSEEDHPNPINTYGITKLAGEYYTHALCQNYLIVRSSGIFGTNRSSGKKGNFIETMLQLAHEGKTIHVVDDQITSPTYSLDLAQQITLLIDKDEFGLFHAVSDDSCSWYEFAQTIFAMTKTTADLRPIKSDSYDAPAMRPHFSVLKNKKLEEKNIHIMRSWKKGLKDYLIEKRYFI